MLAVTVPLVVCFLHRIEAALLMHSDKQYSLGSDAAAAMGKHCHLSFTHISYRGKS